MGPSSSEILTDLKFLCNLAPRENPLEKLVSALKKRAPKVFLTGGRGGVYKVHYRLRRETMTNKLLPM